MGVWNEATKLLQDLRQSADTSDVLRDGQMNSARALEWRERVLRDLGKGDPDTTKEAATPSGAAAK